MSQATLHTNAGPITIEFFNDDAPKTITSDAWQHVLDVPTVKPQQKIPLTKLKTPVRHILLWVTNPGRPDDPRAAISELTVRKG